jgi:hypothetical protein
MIHFWLAGWLAGWLTGLLRCRCRNAPGALIRHSTGALEFAFRSLLHRGIFFSARQRPSGSAVGGGGGGGGGGLLESSAGGAAAGLFDARKTSLHSSAYASADSYSSSSSSSSSVECAESVMLIGGVCLAATITLEEIEEALRIGAGGGGGAEHGIQSDHELRAWALKGFEAQ